MSEKSFLIDSTKCIGCGSCQVACKEWNDLPPENFDFFEDDNYNITNNLSSNTWCKVNYLNIIYEMIHQKCYHCNQAICYEVCPANAIYKVDGWTLIDHDKCIGCGACESGCKYKAIHVMRNSSKQSIIKHKAYKCHGCIENKNKKPLCCEVCPTDAIIYDYRLKLIKYAKKRLKNIKKEYPNSNIYGLKEFNGLNVISILKENPKKYNLPINTQNFSNKINNNVKSLYSLLSIVSFGSQFVKRKMYGFAKYIS